MGGFLNGLANVLGEIGTAAASPRLTQQLGPDWRQQLDQREFERQRAQELARQQNEAFQTQQDTALENQLANVSLGAPQGNDQGPLPEPDLASMVPQEVQGARRQRILGSALGRVAQSRPVLQAQQAQARAVERELQGNQAEDQIRLRGEQARSLLELRNQLDQDRTMSPRDRDMLKARLDQQIALLGARGGGRGSRGTFRPLVNDRGEVIGQFNTAEGLTPDQIGQGLRVSPMGAAQQESQVQSAAQLGEIDALNQLYRPDWVGPVAALQYTAQERIPGVPQPEPERAAFASAVANLQNSGIKAITGAQMSEYEVPRLMRELPQMSDKPNVFEAKLRLMNARFQVLADVRAGRISRDEGIRQINSMSLSGGMPRSTPRAAPAPTNTPPQAAGGDTATFQGRTYRLRPGADRRLRSSWEPVQ